ncbi:MAG: hypothetical protein J6C19_03795 [Lachnospiraceae bacterium]|nr:hypothetical protein [Lachnospiraceae bacterium]
MNIYSSRNSLLRARNLRSAIRSRSKRVLSSKTSTAGTNTSSANKTASTASSYGTQASKQIAMYEKMEKSANDIQTGTAEMISIGKMSYTDDETGKKAQENDSENLIANVKSFVTDYNLVYSALDDIGGSANLAFQRSLDNITAANTTALKEIGITVSKTGELTIDKETLANADLEKVKALFAKEGSFADKISAKMEAVESAASNSLTVLNKLYGATSTYSKYGTSNSNYNTGYYNNYSNSSSWYI